VEVRLMDLDPFERVGINADTMRFLDVFLLHCLLRPSPPDNPAELEAIIANKQRVAARGREPGLMLMRDNGEVPFAEWGREVLDQCAPYALALDTAMGTTQHAGALALAHERLADASLTPS